MGERGSWRDHARPIIAEVISCCGPKCDLAFVRKAVSATYVVYEGTGMRKYWPYKVWLDEVRRQLARAYPDQVRARDQKLGRSITYAERMIDDDPRQGSLL